MKNNYSRVITIFNEKHFNRILSSKQKNTGTVFVHSAFLLFELHNFIPAFYIFLSWCCIYNCIITISTWTNKKSACYSFTRQRKGESYDTGFGTYHSAVHLCRLLRRAVQHLICCKRKIFKAAAQGFVQQPFYVGWFWMRSATSSPGAGGSLSSKGEPRALPKVSSWCLIL